MTIASACSNLELLCRMKIGTPAFGTGALAAGFDVLPAGQGVVVRKRGSTAELAANGSLWAPYSQSDQDLAGATGGNAGTSSTVASNGAAPPASTAGQEHWGLLAIAASRVPRHDAAALGTAVAAEAQEWMRRGDL